MSASAPPIDARLLNFNYASAAAPSSSASTTQASLADALSVYSDAVQTPEVECGNLDSLYCDVQAIDTDRPEARILREDFCSSAMVAHSWLNLHPGNTSQGVDIDLAALERARQTFGGAPAVRLIQSAEYAGGAEAVELSGRANSSAIVSTTQASKVKHTKGATWEQGAATDRMERRLAKRLAASAKAERKAAADGSGSSTPRAAQGPRLTLVHSDVLSLPLPPSTRTPSLEAPDLVASLNYALSYFHTRPALLAYLNMVRATLRPKTGVLITDQFAGPSGADLYPHNQDELWERFSKEPGFMRPGDPRPTHKGSPLQVYPAPSPNHEALDSADARLWPRGRLILVRKGEEAGGFEYWREDGPVDWVTNRFRMSLSFRFADGSWLRDVFSYDFRVWSLKEVTEAMEEAGFAFIRVSVIPRTATGASEEAARAAVGRSSVDDLHASPGESRSRSSSLSSGTGSSETYGEEGMGLDGFASLLKRTEKEESEKVYYQVLNAREKLFASRSFGTYIAARAP